MMLSEEQGMIRDMARDFAKERLAPFAAEWDRQGEAPREALKEMGGLGLMGMCIPEDWGGSGTDYVSYVLALEEIASGDGGVSTIMSVNNAPVGAAINSFGTEAQKDRFLRPLASGEIIGAFSLTEPQAGSDASNLRTKARRDGNKYVLSGTKQFITSGSIAGVNMVFAVTDPEAGKKGISAFLVPTDSPGYRVAGIEKKLGQRSSDTCQIVFDDMEVTPDLLLGEEGQGYRIALANLETGRIGIAAQATGMARAAYEAALAYAKERESFGKPIIQHQAVGFPAGRHGDQDRGLTPDASPCREPARRRPALPQGGVHGQAVRREWPEMGRTGLLGCDPDPRGLRLSQRFPRRAHLPRCPGLSDLRGHQRRAAPGNQPRHRGGIGDLRHIFGDWGGQGHTVALLAGCWALATSGNTLLVSTAALTGHMLAPDKGLATLPIARCNSWVLPAPPFRRRS